MFYERFAALCQERNVTAAAVSRATGIATATLSNWKKGNYTPKTDKLQKIADYFGVPLTYFTAPDGVEDFVHQNSYYIDEETVELARKILTDPDYRILYGEVMDSRPEDIRMVADLLHRFKEDARRR